MTSSSRTIACLLTLVMAVGTATVVETQAFSRVACEVVDDNDEPLKGAVVTATTPAQPSFEASEKTSKRGKCVISVSDGTVPYLFKVELEGFQTLAVEVQPEVGKLIKRVFKLSPAGEADTSAAVLTADEKRETRAGARNIILYNEGVEARQGGDPEGALAKFIASVELDQEFAPAFGGIASVALELGRYQQAAEAAEKALELDPEDYTAMRIRYDAYRNLGDKKKAEAAAKGLREAGDVKQVALRVFQEAVGSFKQGDVDLAKVRFRQAVELDTELVEAYTNLAQIYNQEGNMVQAAEMAAQALERQPDNTIVLKIHYDALRGLGDSEGAKEALRALIVADPSWAGVKLFDYAQQLFNNNQLGEARTVLEELVEVQPDHPEAHYLLGLCCNSSGDIKTAAGHFERFLELAPDHEAAPVARDILSFIK